MKKYIHKIPRLGRLMIMYISGIVFLMSTNPQKLPSVVLILPFVALFVMIYLTVIELLKLLSSREDEKVAGEVIVRPRRTAILLAAVPTLLLVLQSIGQLGAKDILTVSIILIIGYFYIVKSTGFSLK